MRRVVKVVLSLLLVLIVVAGSVLLYLIFPGTPSRSHSMNFDGYIHLPKGKVLSILDYLTIGNHALFVTEESSGTVYKVNLNPSTQLADGDVSRLSGTGSVHGVLLLPGENIAFVTRAETNTVDVFDPTSL